MKFVGEAAKITSTMAVCHADDVMGLYHAFPGRGESEAVYKRLTIREYCMLRVLARKKPPFSLCLSGVLVSPAPARWHPRSCPTVPSATRPCPPFTTTGRPFGLPAPAAVGCDKTGAQWQARCLMPIPILDADATAPDRCAILRARYGTPISSGAKWRPSFAL